MEPEGTDIIAVVKADAYGHGVLPIAAKARAEGVKILAVANLHEVERLRDGGDQGEILVLGAPPFGDELPAAMRIRPTLAVFTAEQVERIAAAGGGRVAGCGASEGAGRASALSQCDHDRHFQPPCRGG